jgi:hypothetical protein
MEATSLLAHEDSACPSHSGQVVILKAEVLTPTTNLLDDDVIGYWTPWITVKLSGETLAEEIGICGQVGDGVVDDVGGRQAAFPIALTIF